MNEWQWLSAQKKILIFKCSQKELKEKILKIGSIRYEYFFLFYHHTKQTSKNIMFEQKNCQNVVNVYNSNL